MTMVNGWGQPPPHKSCHVTARCVYVVCLVASVLSIVVLAYSTSYHPLASLVPGKHSPAPSNSEDINTIQIVGLVNKNGDKIRLDSLMGDSPKGVLELRWMKNESAPGTTTPSRVKTTPTNPNINFEAKLNCTGVNKTSELLSMEPFKFLQNFKNPCWYEPLVKANAYDKTVKYGNAKGTKSMFREMTEEWNNRLEELAEPKRLRCLPYFFIAGQPKCGSTDLYQKLTSHPDVVTPPMKEPHWWGKTRFRGESSKNSSRSVPFPSYLDLFDKAALFIEHVSDPNSAEEDQAYHQLITGDSSVSTLWFNDYWYEQGENCGHSEPRYTNTHYIRYMLPRSRIIVILRDPTERLYSDYLYFSRNRQKSADDFHKEVVIAVNALETCLTQYTMRSCIYNRTVARTSKVRLRIGIYYVFLEEWLRVFPRHQIQVLRLEDYSVEPLDNLKTIFKFLGLRSLTVEEEEVIFQTPKVANARRKKDRELGVMRDDTRALLNKFYQQYNQKLAILLHDNRYLWQDT